MTPLLTPSFSQVGRRASKKGVLAAAGALLFLVGIWYAVAANAVVSASYRYYDALTQQQEIAREVEMLRVKTAQALAPEAMETKALKAGFSQIVKPEYLSLPGTLVAQR